MGHYKKFYTNQIYSSSLLSQLAYMWKNEVLCDAVIRSGPLCVKAHRILLIASCPMLQTVENATIGSQLEVRLAAHIKLDSIHTFLQYLYEGFMLLTEENCRDVEKIARLLQVESIMQCCADFHKSIGSEFDVRSDYYRFGYHNNNDFHHVRCSDVLTSQDQVGHGQGSKSNTSSLPHKRGPSESSSHVVESKKTKTSSCPGQVDTAKSTSDSISRGEPFDFSNGNRLTPNPRSYQRDTSIDLSSTSHNQDGVIDLVEDCIEIVETSSDGRSVGGFNIVNQRVVNSGTQVLHINNAGSCGRPHSNGSTHRNSDFPRSTISSKVNKSPRLVRETSSADGSIFIDNGHKHSTGSTSDHTPSQHNWDETSSVSSSQATVQRTLSDPNLPTTVGRSSNSRADLANSISTSSTTPDHTATAISDVQVMQHFSASDHSVRSQDSSEEKASKRKEDAYMIATDRQLVPSGHTELVDLTIVKQENEERSQCTGISQGYRTYVGHGREESHSSSAPHPTPHIPGQPVVSLSHMLPPLQHQTHTAPFFLGEGQIPVAPYGFPLFPPRRASLEDLPSDDHHKLVFIVTRKPCVWCQINGVKTKSGWYCYASYKCNKCDIPLCKQGRDCFMEYHKHIGVPISELNFLEPHLTKFST